MTAPDIIGGNGYRWRGRSIRTVHRENVTCVTMPRKDSIIMTPVSVLAGAHYKVTITASKNSGNGSILINFFGGKNYDGSAILVSVTNVEMRDYTISVPVPKFPPNLPVYLRVWRPDNASGNVYIKIIQYTLISGPVNVPREPVLIKKQQSNGKVLKDKIKKFKSKVKPPVIKKINKDNPTMKFKPYVVNRSTTMVDHVCVRKPEDVPKVSIITPTRNGLVNIQKCYDALNKNTSYPNWEWIIGDSASTDGTLEYIKGLNDNRIKLVERNTTEGSFSSINNDLTLYASGAYYLFLNDDTMPQPFWLYEMMAKITHMPDVGIVGAKLLYAKDKIQHCGIAFIPQGPANIGKSVLGAFPSGFADHDRFYQAVTGACLLISERDFKAVGGFDPVYYFCYEDVDLCLKVRKQLNKKVLYASRAEVIHAESATQKIFKTSGELQKKGIEIFKQRWMQSVEIDFPTYQRDNNKGLVKTDVSFVTCTNNLQQYSRLIAGSLFKNITKLNYEIIPILNFDNVYSAAQALNIGLDRARGRVVVFCHQDVMFYESWVDMLFERIEEIEKKVGKNWGVLGTAGINERDDTIGVVHNMKGSIQWQSTKRSTAHEVQTVDEHCMIIRKESGLRFDESTFNGFHFYGPDLCLSAIDKKMKNYGILCPLVHESSSSSLLSGKQEFMRLLNALAKKWRSKFNRIRTPTSIIRKRSVRTFVKFKNK